MCACAYVSICVCVSVSYLQRAEALGAGEHLQLRVDSPQPLQTVGGNTLQLQIDRESQVLKPGTGLNCNLTIKQDSSLACPVNWGGKLGSVVLLEGPVTFKMYCSHIVFFSALQA